MISTFISSFFSPIILIISLYLYVLLSSNKKSNVSISFILLGIITLIGLFFNNLVIFFLVISLNLSKVVLNIFCFNKTFELVELIIN